MTNDEIRRQLRRQLQAARCRDDDHSESRYAADALKLDQELKRLGAYEYPTMWGSKATRIALKKGEASPTP